MMNISRTAAPSDKPGRPLAAAALFLAALLACAAAFAQEAAPAAGTPEAGGAPSGEPLYTYKTGRDPFVPLVGQGGGGGPYAVGGDEEPGEFNAAGLELSGILKTRTGRWAIIRDPGGASYMVRDGKIYDPKRKAVPGYVGIVKEKTLVVIGPNNTVTELALKKDAEEEK